MVSTPDWVSLLRDPSGIAERCVQERDLAPLARTSLASIVLGAAVPGGVLG